MEEIKDENEQQPTSEEVETEVVEEKDELTILQEQNIRLLEQMNEAKDNELRTLAEMENVRKRLVKEFDDKLKYSNQNLIAGLFPVMDNFETALDHINPEAPVESLKEGVELTLKQMREVLEKNGLEEIELNIGDEFNPLFHEALMVEASDEYDNNSVLMILQKGYKLHGRVVRPSKVKVNKKG
ncbi:MAG: nucleotide exchange factor GrpE [Denitrovibrio sp.]|nr:MAG: nucleotide exchange factor GrpE [Denitrovibrio sp.]